MFCSNCPTDTETALISGEEKNLSRFMKLVILTPKRYFQQPDDLYPSGFLVARAHTPSCQLKCCSATLGQKSSASSMCTRICPTKIGRVQRFVQSTRKHSLFFQRQGDNRGTPKLRQQLQALLEATGFNRRTHGSGPSATTIPQLKQHQTQRPTGCLSGCNGCPTA